MGTRARKQRERFSWRSAPGRYLAGLPEIAGRARAAAGLLEVHAENTEGRSRIGRMSRFEAFPDSLMEPAPPRRRDPVVQRVAVERMAKRIRARRCAVRPFVRSCTIEEDATQRHRL